MILALPQTMMNASGGAVAALCNSTGIEPSEICVVLDEVELPLGTLRLRGSGSAGGHNGMVSIISALGTNEFPRLRIGVRSTWYSKQHDLADYVLDRFGRSEGQELKSTLERAAQSLRLWVSGDIDAAMKFANTKPSSPGSASDPD